MKKIEITLETGNAAFQEGEGGEGAEVARILRDLAEKLEKGKLPYHLYDSNGNKVGIVNIW